MKAKRRAGILLVGIGAALLAAALLLFLHNRQEDSQAAQAANEALIAVQEAISNGTATAPTADPEEADTDPTASTDPTQESAEAGELAVVTIDGHDYVGYLSVPSLGLELPVMKIVYLEDLQIAPCLQYGSPLTDDAVIAAHNYASHFGPLRDMEGGETIIFTDMNGDAITYTVAEVKTIQPTDVTAVTGGDYDLVLYTCTTGGQARVMVGCQRAE